MFCLNSADSDFKSYGWILARDYACKVTNKVDQELVSWVEMAPGVQTADLVSAQCDYPRPATLLYPEKNILTLIVLGGGKTPFSIFLSAQVSI